MKATAPASPAEQVMPQDLHLISFEYTLHIENGEKIDSNVGMEPLCFQSGLGQMLPALEAELIQLQAGETKIIILPPEKAYGLITEEAHREIPLTAIPEEARQVGSKVKYQAPDGAEETVEIIAIRDDIVVLDFNHPFAGNTLHFDVKVLSNESFNTTQ